MKKKTLRKELIKLLIAVSLIPLLLIAIISGVILQKNLVKNFNTIVENGLGQVSQSIMSEVKNNKEIVDYFSKDPNAKNITAQDSTAWFKKTIDSYTATHKNVSSIYIGTKDKRMILSPDSKVPEGFDPTSRDWYKLSMENKDKILVGEPYIDIGTKNIIVTISKAVVNDNNDMVGVVGLDIKLDYLSELASKIKLGNNGYAVLISPNGTILAHPNKELMGKTPKDTTWINEVLKIKNKAIGNVYIDDEKFIVFRILEDTSGFNIISFVPEKDITKLLINAMILPFVIMIIMFIFLFILSKIFSNKLTNPINEIVDVLNHIKDGDFTKKLERSKKNTYEINTIVDSLNILVDNMVGLLSEVKTTSRNVQESSESMFVITKESSTAGEEIAKAIQQIATGSTEQASQLEESVNISTNLAEEIESSMEKSNTMLNLSTEVEARTLEGAKAVRDLKLSFKEQEEGSIKVQEKVNIVSVKSSEITSITDTIKAITEQTNLLALNASIEAARAGEAGKGFAVVSEEVRKLADESSTAAEQIGKAIEEINHSVKELLTQITYTADLNTKTGKGIEITAEQFDMISSMIISLKDSIASVSSSLNIIEGYKDSVLQQITNVASVAQETAATTQEVSAASEEQSSGLQEIYTFSEKLKDFSERLDNLVAKFKL